MVVAKKILDQKKHGDYGFNGCAVCDAKCCSSSIIFASLYDLSTVVTNFPVLFYVRDKQISPVYFFYYGEQDGQKCPYLVENLCSIYERRPYACRAYPFSFEQGKACYDDGCPQVASLEAGGMPLYSDKKTLSPSIMDNFVSTHFNNQQGQNIDDSERFTNFCLKNNLLVAYKDFYAKSALHLEFKPSLVEQLFMLHPQRLGVMRMKNKLLFEGVEEYLPLVVKMISSYATIENLAKLRQNI
jgi:Fe-S-cluster containining protein